MQEGEKKIRAGDVFKRFGLSRGDLAELEEDWGLIYYVSTRNRKRPGVTGKRQHRWYASEITEAIERRKASAVAEAEKRRIATDWNNGGKAAFVAKCRGEWEWAGRQISAGKTALKGESLEALGTRIAEEVTGGPNKPKRKGKGKVKEYTDFQVKCREAM